jgi:hypothetical protein
MAKQRKVRKKGLPNHSWQHHQGLDVKKSALIGTISIFVIIGFTILLFFGSGQYVGQAIQVTLGDGFLRLPFNDQHITTINFQLEYENEYNLNEFNDTNLPSASLRDLVQENDQLIYGYALMNNTLNQDYLIMVPKGDYKIIYFHAYDINGKDIYSGFNQAITEETCSAERLDLCNNQTVCENNGFYWDGTNCLRTEPECNLENLQYCSEEECNNLNKVYDGTCQNCINNTECSDQYGQGYYCEEAICKVGLCDSTTLINGTEREYLVNDNIYSMYYDFENTSWVINETNIEINVYENKTYNDLLLEVQAIFEIEGIFNAEVCINNNMFSAYQPGTDDDDDDNDDNDDNNNNNGGSSSKSSGGGGGKSCTPDIVCNPKWSPCNLTLKQVQTCYDKNGCIPSYSEVRDCDKCEESWICREWSECLNDYQTRDCYDETKCGTYQFQPETKKSCSVELKPVQKTEPYQQPKQPEVYQPVVEEKSVWPYIIAAIVGLIVLIGGAAIGYQHYYNVEKVSEEEQFQQLKDWVKKERDHGVSDEEMKRMLKENTSWNDNEINQALEG